MNNLAIIFLLLVMGQMIAELKHLLLYTLICFTCCVKQVNLSNLSAILILN